MSLIDLIIPYYNNRIGLLNTLKSINTDIFKITVIDDHSTETPIIYNSVAQVFRYNINSGPGYARQLGINKTNNSYIMFIDTGDIFISKEIQEKIANVIQANPEANMIVFNYYYQDKLTSNTDNRMHGKVYKRAFLEKYNITFCPSSSYMDEDIGFNRACRICTESELQPIVYVPNPIIRWIEDSNSLTKKDNNVALYRDQTRALSLVSIHAIETCRKNNINPTRIEIEMEQIAIGLYYWFIRTAAERPEYIQEAWTGAKIFYDYYRKEIKPNTLYIGTKFIKKCAEYRDKIAFPINVLRFVHDIQLNEIIPNNYLT